MSAGMPELGSKISLISKADIRYEGRLFTVDPTECTIALASVRSFGTEDRDTSYPIMPQPTVYDYILFRGSDIKDIRVVNSVAIPNDPAIMQMHLPQHQPSFAGNTGNQFPPMQGSPMSQFNAFGLQSGNMSSLGQVAAVMKQEQQSQSPIQQQQGKTSKKNLAPASGQKNKKSSELSNGIDVTSMDKSKTTTRKQSNKSQDSRSGTPNLSRKSPVSDRGHQANQNQRDNQAGNKENSRQGPRNNQQRNNNQQQPRERRDSGRNEVQEVRGDKGGYRNRPNNNGMNNHPQQPQHQQQQRGYNNNRSNNYNGNNNNQMRGNNQGGSARMRGPPMHMNNYRQHANQGTPNQNQNNNNKPTNGQQTQRKPLKFENEFDFDEANSKFEELRANLARLKVRATEEPQPTEQVNGEVEKKDDSGNETSADPEDANGYDKNKSFFDNISCEAVERSKGKTQRTNWREERKINSETFGYTFNRRGNFRGRGGYYQNSYNRGPRPGDYRGGNQNYRPVRNLRNQNIVEGRPNAPASNGQQSQTMAAVVAAN